MDNQLRAMLEASPPTVGLTIADVMLLPAPLSSALNRMIRRGPLALDDLAVVLDTSPEEAHQIGELLVARGYCLAGPQRTDGQMTYQARLARKPGRLLPDSFWKALDDLP
jgi:hypothetical protein